MINYADFTKVDIRLGTVLKAETFPEARRPALKLWVDFGAEVGVKKTSAQITQLYSVETLPGTQVMAVVNFPTKQIGPFMSECLVLGFENEDGHVVLASPRSVAPNGRRLI